MAPRVAEILLKKRIKECLEGGTLPEVSMISTELKNVYSEYTRYKEPLFISMITSALQGLQVEIIPSGMTPNKRKRQLPKKQVVKDPITLSDSDHGDQDAKEYPDTNFGNSTLQALYAHNKPIPALATVSPTISTKPINNNCITMPALPAQTNGVSIPKETVRDTQEPVVKKRNTRKSSATTERSMFKSEVPSVRTVDMGGVDSQTIEGLRFLLHMKRRKIYEKQGVQGPVGLLIHGPPGCGKTRFAQSLAGELEMPMIQVACTELISGVSGESENKIRQLFQQARENGPCLLLLDDVDIISSRRDTAQREMEKRIVTQLIACFDDLAHNENQASSSTEQPLRVQFDNGGNISVENQSTSKGQVFVLATTSRLESIDLALRRPGRFDKELSIGIPDENARREILSVVCSKIQFAEDVSLKQIARLTPGYVGADLVALAREALVSATDRVLGTFIERKKMDSKEKKREIERLVISFGNIGDDESEKLETVEVEFKDFERALNVVSPSAIREGFATVPDVTWDDIGALKDVRSELEWSILNQVKYRESYEALGIGNQPQGVLLCGPPGCGKTLLAKAVANESGFNFISVKGPELLNMYVGESEKAVRTVFQRARDSAPCVIFFDEVDALCPKRSSNETSGSARLVNQMLTEMDGIHARKEVFLMAATNRPDMVDGAIMRPGRLDKVVFVDFPNMEDRVDILRKSTKNGTHPKISPDVRFEEVAALPALQGYTGADLSALVHQAGVQALRERLNNNPVEAITFAHFIEASQRITPSVSKADRVKYEQLKEKYKKL